MKRYLLLYPGSKSPDTGIFTEIITLDSSPNAAHEQIQSLVRGVSDEDTLIFWDQNVGDLSVKTLTEFEASRDDVWHPGNLYPPSVEIDLLKYEYPTDIHRGAIPRDLPNAGNFRLTFHAALVQARIMRRLGNLETGFQTLDGAALEMGWRWHRRGAILRQQPDMLEKRKAYTLQAPPITDQYRLLALHAGISMKYIAALFRCASGANPIRELQALRKIDKSRLRENPCGIADRDLNSVALPANPNVSVILPTFGRYKYVAELLEDLRTQTIKPRQILIADGNQQREPEVYERFKDLPIQVLWLNEQQTGTCAPRNACLERITGDYVWFLDDDSRIDEKNLENHLRLLEVYGADVSVGPAYTRDRPELHSFQRDVHSTFMDCGTTLCRTDILEKSGGFDMQYNEYLAGEDGDIGDRFIIAGGLMLNNPYAKRFHYLAPVGGARTSKNNLHRWKRWSLSPRPVQSIYYRAYRYFGPGVAAWSTFLSWIRIGQRRKEGQQKTTQLRVLMTVSEVLALPVSLFRLWRSVRVARQMLAEGPKIPPVKRKNPSSE